MDGRGNAATARGSLVLVRVSEIARLLDASPWRLATLAVALAVGRVALSGLRRPGWQVV